MPSLEIALIGDYSAGITAHRAIPEALRLAAAETSCHVVPHWIGTDKIVDAPRDLAEYHAVWCVPGSPYKSMDGALAAIRWARTGHRPFLGTCGGFQHALVEFARACAGLPAADHTETSPDTTVPLITMLPCSLVEKNERINFAPGSLFARAYQTSTAQEGYRCNFGLNPDFAAILAAAGLQFTAHSTEGKIRGAELPETTHPFFVGALFQPERAALRHEVPPLVRTFVRAALEHFQNPPGTRTEILKK